MQIHIVIYLLYKYINIECEIYVIISLLEGQS